MNIVSKLSGWVKGLGKFSTYGPGGGMGLGWAGSTWLSGSSYNYYQEAGKRYDNSVVYTALMFLNRKQSETTMRLEQRGGDDKFVPAKLDPITPVFRRPNAFYGESVLWAGMLLSWICDGNVYLYVVPNQMNQVYEIWYVPHFFIRPRADRNNPDGSKPITYYQYTPLGGTPVDIDPENIIHLRCGIDPLRPACGIGPLTAVLREICGDNEASTYSAAMLRNMGVPGVIMAPKPVKAGDSYTEATPERRERMKELWNSFRRDARGGILALPMPMDINYPAFDPQKLQLKEVRNDAAGRILAAIGLDAMAVGLPSENKTYSNYEEALKAAIHNCVLPTLKDIAGQLLDALADRYQLDRNQYRLGFDLSEMYGLQEDVDGLHSRWRENFKAGMVDRATAKERIGEKPNPDDVGVYAGSSEPEEPEPDPKAPAEERKSLGKKAAGEASSGTTGDDSNLLKRRPGQRAFKKALFETRSNVHGVIDKLAANEYTTQEWFEHFNQALKVGYTQAWKLGRQRSGDLRIAYDEHGYDADGLHGRGAMDANSEWVQDFRDKIQDGGYTLPDGSLDVDAIKRRADHHVQKMRGIANEAFVEHSEDDAEFTWHCHKDDATCDDCEFWADESPYGKDDIPTYPGNCECQCHGNCRCHLSRNDGVTGFKAVRFAAAKTEEAA